MARAEELRTQINNCVAFVENVRRMELNFKGLFVSFQDVQKAVKDIQEGPPRPVYECYSCKHMTAQWAQLAREVHNLRHASRAAWEKEQSVTQALNTRAEVLDKYLRCVAEEVGELKKWKFENTPPGPRPHMEYRRDGVPPYVSPEQEAVLTESLHQRLSLQKHGVPVARAPQPVRNAHQDAEDDITDSATAGRLDAYTARDLCRNTIGVPSWNGKSLTWNRFMKEWKAYWEIQGPIAGPKVKKWIFIRGLPERWKAHMRAYITDANWSYEDIVNFLSKQCDIMVPDWKKEQQWRNCLPQGATYIDFTHWWLTWKRLGDDCDLREQDWVHQFNACLNYKNFFGRYLKEILETEMSEGTNVQWNLERRKTFVENKLMIAYKAQETLQEVSREAPSAPRSPLKTSVSGACFHCGEQGHFASRCPRKRRSASVPARGGHPNFSRERHPPGGQQHGGGPPPRQSGYQRYGGGRGERYHRDDRGRNDQKPTESRPRISDGKPLPLERDEVDRRKAAGLCLHCAKPGHGWRECPVRNSQQERKQTTQRHVASHSDGRSPPDAGKGKSRPSYSGKGKSAGRGRGRGKGRHPYGVKTLYVEGDLVLDVEQCVEEYHESLRETEQDYLGEPGSDEEPPDMA